MPLPFSDFYSSILFYHLKKISQNHHQYLSTNTCSDKATSKWQIVVYLLTCVLMPSMIKNCAFSADQAVARHTVEHEHLINMLLTEWRTMQRLFVSLQRVKRQDAVVLGDSYSSVSQNAVRAQKLGALQTSGRRRCFVLAVCAMKSILFAWFDGQMIQCVCQKEVAWENVGSLRRNRSQFSTEGTNDRVGSRADHIVTLEALAAKRVKTFQDLWVVEDVLADWAF